MGDPTLAFSPNTELWFQILLITSTVLLIPIAIGFLVVFFKSAFLIHSIYELVTVARYELFPLIKDIRLTVDNVEQITSRTNRGMADISENLSQVRPNMEYGLANMKTGVKAFVTGIRRSFKDK